MASGKRSLHLRFGGWGSYQEWAEQGFTPKPDRRPDPPAEPDTEPDTETVAAPAVEAPPGPAAEPAAGPADSNGARRAPPADDRRSEPPPKPRKYGPPVPPRPHPVDPYPAPPQVRRPDEPLIRPYILTGGRTRPRHDLDVHALVHTTGRGRASTRTLPAEQESIREMCRFTRSVAEVAALLRVPLGVARILIDDMEGQDLIAVTLPPQEDDHSVELLTRVLEGLRRL